jgi:hypothetical protein
MKTGDEQDHWNLAGAIKPNLKEGALMSCAAFARQATVVGDVNLSHGNLKTKVCANIRIVINCNWRKREPTVYSAPSWLNRQPGKLEEWHIYHNYSLCWVLPQEWSDTIANWDNNPSLSKEDVVGMSAGYLLNNVRYLLFRHYEGTRRKLVDWPTEWDAWPHGKGGERAYIRQKEKTERRKWRPTPLII